MATAEKPLSVEERVANQILGKLPVTELVAQMRQTNELISQLMALSEQLAQSTEQLRQQSQEDRILIAKTLESLTSKFTAALAKLGLPIQNPLEIASQIVTVATAGDAAQLPIVHIPVGKAVRIKALSTNTGTIYIGNNKPEAEGHTLAYLLIATDGPVKYEINNLSQLWIDASVGGEGISWTVEQEERR